MPLPRLRPAPPSRNAWLLGLLAAVLVTGAAAGAAPAAAQVRRVEDTFPSAGRPIAVERFEPAAGGKHPALVLLHAIDGLETPYGVFYHCAAQKCAAEGYVVVLVHYFDRTGDKDAKVLRTPFLRWAKGDSTSEAERTALREHFAAWTDTVRDAVRYTQGRPNVATGRVGLVGFSLGAFLALAAAADEGLQVAAVVEFFGGMPAEGRARLKTLPPVLIIHGDHDQTVPVREARALEDWLAARALPAEVKVYPGVGHVFQRPGGGFDWDALRDAERRAAAFVERYVRRGVAAGREPGVAGR